MRKIRLIDYYCGAFLSYLVANGVKHTLFEPNTSVRIVEFIIGKDTYKAYIKYSATRNDSEKQGKKYSLWKIPFTRNEIDQLEAMKEPGKKVLVICVCTNEALKDTDIAVLRIRDAYRCLGIGNHDIVERPRISIQHQKGSSNLRCYGTGLDAVDAIEVYHDIDKIFGINQE